MKTRITNGLEERFAEQLKGEYVSCFHLRQRIIELLRKDVDALHQSMRNEEDMNSASWPYLQATRLGEVKALLRTISLFDEK